MHNDVATRGENFEIERHPYTKDRPIIIVLGTHCSGASLLGGVLRALGVDMADESEISGDDRHAGDGRSPIARLHDEVLEAIGRPIESIAHGMPLAPGWWRDRTVQRIKDDIRDWLGGELGRTKNLWGFEDPRTVRLLPLWREILREMNLTPRFVIALRSPNDPLPSHAQTDLDLRPLKAIERELNWLAYNYDVLRLLRVQRGLVIDHADWIKEPEQTAQRLVQELGLEPGMDLDEQGECVGAIVRNKARRQHREGQPSQPSFPLADGLYDTIRTFDTVHEDSHRTSMVLSMLDVTFRALSPVLKIAAQLAPARVDLVSTADALRLAQSQITALRDADNDQTAEGARQQAALHESFQETRYELKLLEEKNQAEAASRKAQAAEHAKALEEMRQKAARLEKELALSNEAHKKEIEAHQDVRRVFNQAAEKLANARQDLAKAKQDLATRNEAAAQLRASADAGAKELQIVSARLVALEGEIKQLRHRDREAIEQAQGLTRARDELAGEIEQLRIRDQEAMEQAQSLTQARDELAREIEQLRHRDREAVQQAQILTKACDDLEFEVEQLRHRNGEAVKQAEILSKARDDLTRDVKQLRQREQETIEQAEVLTRARDGFAREIEQLRAREQETAKQVQSLLKAREGLEQENEQLRQREREAMEQAQSLSESRDRLTLEFQAALKRHAELEDTAKALAGHRDALQADLTAERCNAALTDARFEDELLVGRGRASKIADLEQELEEERCRTLQQADELQRLSRDHAIALAALEQDAVRLGDRFAQELAENQGNLSTVREQADEDRKSAAKEIAKLAERADAGDQTKRALEHQITAIYASRSWKLGAPLRAVMRTVKGTGPSGPRPD